MEVNWIDIFCGSVLLILVGIGIFFGLAKTIVHLIAWIGGAIGVIYAPEFLGPFLAENFDVSKTTLIILTRVLGFLVPFILLRILGHFINKFIKRHFSMLNAIGGGILGLVKGLIPCILLLSTLYLLPLGGKLLKQRDDSKAFALYSFALKKTGAENKIQHTHYLAPKKWIVNNRMKATVENAVKEALDSTKMQAEQKLKFKGRL